MKSLRFLVSLAFVALLVAALSGARETRASEFAPASCSAPALSAAFTGALRISDVASYACIGSWAYLWATVGTGEHAVGVTEVVHLNSTTNSWLVSSRLKVCLPGVMPEFIYHQGCFSN